MLHERQIINYLRGGKGGGGSPPPPTRTPDNLRSKDTVEVILAISEGPIFGLPNGAKDFKIGDTALQNQSGDYNFQSFVLNFFPGTDNPNPIIPVLGGISSNNAVNVTLVQNVSVTRTTSVRNIDFIDVRLAFQRLFVSNDSGTFNASATYRIEYKKTSDVSFTKAFGQDVTITGKTSGLYVKETRIAVPSIDDDDYDIRVTKVSGESDSTYFCDLAFESFQETIADNGVFPNTACIQLVGQASDQFSSIPQWSGVYRGLLVQVPSNYDPITREYTGAWDGTWQIAWTNNPAWCLYDFVMNDRYGVRSYYPNINLDKYDVYDAAQWCDEQVPDGKGGTQPRYTFNANLTEPSSGKELARYIAGTFNATFFDDLNGKAYLRVDKDDNATHIFMKENVFDDGNFEYSYTDITSRYNDITVTFINPELNWVTDRRRVYSQELIDKNGRIPYDFIAVGCTNAHEAIRRGWHKLITANTETCLITFRANRLGSLVNPFDVMLICDPDMGYGISGRIKTIADDQLSIALRTPVYLEVGVNYVITFTLNDGTKTRIPLTAAAPGYNYTLVFNGELPDGIPEKATFAIEAEGVAGTPRPFRVTQVEEDNGSPDSFIIQGLSINRNKWYDADNITDSGVIKYSALPSPFNPPGPTSCAFDERFVFNLKQFQITVSPVFDRGAYKYYANDHTFEVWSRLAGSGDAYTKREVIYGDTLVDHPPGLYEFKILGKSYIGNTTSLDSAPVYVFNVSNPKDPPADIDWIKINKREVYWGYGSPPDDFAGYILRYHNRAGRTTWDDAIQPHEGLLSHTSFYTQLIPPSARVIMVRPVDAFGITSLNSAVILRELNDLDTANVIDQIDFHPTWSGTKTNCTVDGTTHWLQADDTGTKVYSGTPTAFLYEGGDMYKAVYNEMVYESSFTIGSGGQMVIDIDFEGSGYEVTYKLSTDTVFNPVPELQELEAGTYDIRLRIFGGEQRGVVKSFSVLVDVDDVVEDLQDLSVTSAGLRLPITKTYSTIKIVSVTIQGTIGATAVNARVMDKDTTVGAGPLVKLVDSSGAFVSGVIDATVKGYL